MLDPTRIVVIDAEQLKSIVRDAVKDALSRLQPAGERTAEPAAEFLSYQQAAAFAGISESTIRRAVARGELSPANSGSRAVRFSRDSLRRWMGLASGQPAA